MREELLKIVGFGMEPERAEIMVDEIMKLMKREYERGYAAGHSAAAATIVKIMTKKTIKS